MLSMEDCGWFQILFTPRIRKEMREEQAKANLVQSMTSHSAAREKLKAQLTSFMAIDTDNEQIQRLKASLLMGSVIKKLGFHAFQPLLEPPHSKESGTSLPIRALAASICYHNTAGVYDRQRTDHILTATQAITYENMAFFDEASSAHLRLATKYGSKQSHLLMNFARALPNSAYRRTLVSNAAKLHLLATHPAMPSCVARFYALTK